MKKVLLILIFLTILGTFIFSKNVNAQDLVGYWSFDDCTTTDLSGYGNDGTIYGATCESADCHSPSCLSFDGDDYVNVTDSASLNPTNAITLEVWIKLNSKSAWDKILSKPYTAASSPYQQYALSLDENGDKIGFELTTGGIKSEVWSTTSPIIGTWYHVVGVYNGTHMSIYLNGIEESSMTKTGSIDNYSMNLSVGRYEYNPAQYLNGVIDEVKMYNRALTADEVYDHYIGITTTTTSTTTTPVGQVSISGQLMNATGMIEANISVFNQGTEIINVSQITSDGNYGLGVWPGVYDLQYGIFNFFIPNFWIKLISFSITSNLQDVVNYVTGYPSENKVSFTVNITTDQEIQVYSESEPKTVKVNGTEMTEVDSPSGLITDTWFYNSTENRLYMIASPVLPTTTTTPETTSTVSTSTTTTTLTTTTIVGGLSKLHTEGIYIKDKDGNIVNLKGMAAYPRMPRNRYFEPTEEDIQWIASKGFNVIRIVMHWEDDIEPDQGMTEANFGDLSTDYQNDPLYIESGVNYFEDYLDPVIRLCKQYNIYVILDMHQIYLSTHFQPVQGWARGMPAWFFDSYNQTSAGQSQAGYDFWYGQGQAGQARDGLIEIWKFVANRYTNTFPELHDTIAAYDLFNEPYAWMGSREQDYYDDVINFFDKNLTPAIRSVDPDTIVLYDAYEGYPVSVNAPKQTQPNVIWGFSHYRIHCWNLTHGAEATLQNLYDLFCVDYNAPWIIIEIGHYDEPLLSEWVNDSLDASNQISNNNFGFLFWRYSKGQDPSAPRNSDGTDRPIVSVLQQYI